MKHLFYTAVEMITSNITGLESTSLKLWNVCEWIRVHEDVITYLNLACLTVTVLVGIAVVSMIWKCFKRKHV